MLVVALIAAIAAFLIVQALPAFHRAGWRFVTERAWFPDAAPARFGIAALAFGTVVSSLVALVLAVPVALGTALFLTELAPLRLGRWVGYLVDLLAAVPSVVYGLWGVYFLVPWLVPVGRGLDRALGFIPIFHSRNGTYGRSLFAASVILAIMILPIITAIARKCSARSPAPIARPRSRWGRRGGR